MHSLSAHGLRVLQTQGRWTVSPELVFLTQLPLETATRNTIRGRRSNDISFTVTVKSPPRVVPLCMDTEDDTSSGDNRVLLYD